MIALGALLTWVSIERAIVSQRLLPGAIGVIIATVSLGAGPTGLMAVSALLVGLSGLVRIVVRRAETKRDVFAMCAPFLPSGTAILLAVFGDQTLATVIESIRVRSAKGPSLHWYDEWVRYETLMQQNVDGSFTRRFAVMMMFVGVAIVVASILRHRSVPGSLPDPSRRLLLVIFGTMFFMMFTPTKWSHHFGVYAGIGAAIAGLAAVALAHQLSKSMRLPWCRPPLKTAGSMSMTSTVASPASRPPVRPWPPEPLLPTSKNPCRVPVKPSSGTA